MNISIDTNNLSDKDRKLIYFIDDEAKKREEYFKGIIDTKEDEIAALKEEIAELKNEVHSLPSAKGELKEKVKRLFTQDTILTVREVAKAVGHENENSVYGTCYGLIKEGYLDKSDYKRPVKFFLKATGNPELKEMFPEGTKVTVMR